MAHLPQKLIYENTLRIPHFHSRLTTQARSPLLFIQNLGLREVEEQVHGHTAGKWWHRW